MATLRQVSEIIYENYNFFVENTRQNVYYQVSAILSEVNELVVVYVFVSAASLRGLFGKETNLIPSKNNKVGSIMGDAYENLMQIHSSRGFHIRAVQYQLLQGRWYGDIFLAAIYVSLGVSAAT